MSVYVIVSKKVKAINGLPCYFGMDETWTSLELARRYTEDERARMVSLPEDSEWELFDDNEVLIQVKCPKCGHLEFEEITIDATMTTPFKSVVFYKDEDFAEPNYGNTETSVGTVSRYQCAKCGHIIARSIEAFRVWLKTQLPKSPQ